MAELEGVVFVGTSAGNAFMNEILGLLEHELSELGIPTSFSLDTFTSSPGQVHVFIPHEHYGTVDDSDRPTPRQLQRTIALCVEQPGTRWFDMSARVAACAAAVVDINAVGVRELRARGVRAEHLQVGYSGYWDRWHRDESVQRPVDIIHLGTEEPRRLGVLASFGSTVWPYETRVLLPTVAAKPSARADFLVAEKKWVALSNSKVLLNIHRQRLGYFEWVRVLEAVCNGCVVVSESSRDCAPLVAGEHFLAGRQESLGLLASTVIQDPDLAQRLQLDAYDFVRDELTTRASAERLAATAESVVRRSSRSRWRRTTGKLPRLEVAARPSISHRVARRAARRYTWLHDDRARQLAVQERIRSDQLRLFALTKSLLLNDISMRRHLQRAELVATQRDPDLIDDLIRTPAYEMAAPRVSVIVPLYNHANSVQATLASVVGSEYESLELLVLDDASTDRSRSTAVEFMERHPWIAGRVLHHRVNRGLGRTRNDLVAAARGEFVFPLDADNEVYPPAFTRLVAALDHDQEALFAYSALEIHADGVPETLMGHQPWDPDRLGSMNYIDAMAMIRRRELLRLGGYTEDNRLHGWEDYDLWCKAATAEMSAVHVPQILARYRKANDSMISFTNIDTSEAIGVLRASYPTLMMADG